MIFKMAKVQNPTSFIFFVFIDTEDDWKTTELEEGSVCWQEHIAWDRGMNEQMALG